VHLTFFGACGLPGKVAQIFNLPYRRISFCELPTVGQSLELLAALPIENWRYSRLKICAGMTPLWQANTLPAN
jgi:hypothetical protein